MSVRGLDFNDERLGWSYDGTHDYYNIGGSQVNVVSTSCIPVNGAAGTPFRVDYFLNNQDRFVIVGGELGIDIVNSSGTEALTLLNLALIFAELKLLINNQEAAKYSSQEELFLKAQDSIKNACALENDYYAYLTSYLRTEITRTFSGETAGTSATKRVYIDLLKVFFPAYCGIDTVSNNIQKISIEARFANNFGSAAGNGRFALSGTTSNAYGSNITFQNLTVRWTTKSLSNEKLYTIVPQKQKYFVESRFDVISRPSVSWNTTGTDRQVVTLSTDFSSHALCQALWIHIFPVGLVTAYNDTDIAKIYSDYRIGITVKFKSKVIVDYSTANDAPSRIRYLNEVHKAKYNGNFPPSFLHDTSANSLSLFYLPMCCVDLTNIENTEEKMGLGGIDNGAGNNYEVTFTCLSALSTNCNIYLGLEYLSVQQLVNGQVVTIKR